MGRRHRALAAAFLLMGAGCGTSDTGDAGSGPDAAGGDSQPNGGADSGAADESDAGDGGDTASQVTDAGTHDLSDGGEESAALDGGDSGDASPEAGDAGGPDGADAAADGGAVPDGGDAGEGGDAGACGADGTPCGATGQMCCGGACIDPESNLANCGACGSACTITAPSTVACVTGRCVATLGTSTFLALQLGTDATNVYWGDFNTGANTTTLYKVPKTGGATTPVRTVTGQLTTCSVVSDGTYVYWLYGDVPLQGNGYPTLQIAKVTIATGASTTLYGPGQVLCMPTPVDATGLYFATASSIDRVTTAGVHSTVASSASVWANQSYILPLLAIDTATAYWSDAVMSTIWSAPLTGAASETAFLTNQTANALATAPGTVLFTSRGLQTVPSTGGTPSSLASSAGTGSLIVDVSNVYFLNGSAYPSRVALSGGNTTVLVKQAFSDVQAVDAKNVYAISGSSVYAIWPK